MIIRQAVLFLAVAGLFFTPLVQAEPVRPVDQVPAVYTYDLGGIELTAISDGTVPQDLYKLLIGPSHETIDDLLEAHFLENPVEASINAFLFRLGEHTVLVDTGAGAIFGPGFGGKLPEALRAIGVSPSDITDILITHIHSDHTGGLTIDERPMFPNAVVHIAKDDLDFFLDPSRAEESGYDIAYFNQAMAMVSPYVEAGQVKPFEAPAQILPGIEARPFHGHTPGSTVFRMTAGEEEIAFIGDLIHVESVQFPHPDIAIVYDVSPDEAVASRGAAFEELARNRVLVAAPHLSFPGLGHIRAKGNGYEWVRKDFVDRGKQ